MKKLLEKKNKIQILNELKIKFIDNYGIDSFNDLFMEYTNKIKDFKEYFALPKNVIPSMFESTQNIIDCLNFLIDSPDVLNYTIFFILLVTKDFFFDSKSNS